MKNGSRWANEKEREGKGERKQKVTHERNALERSGKCAMP